MSWINLVRLLLWTMSSTNDEDNRRLAHAESLRPLLDYIHMPNNKISLGLKANQFQQRQCTWRVMSKIRCQCHIFSIFNHQQQMSKGTQQSNTSHNESLSQELCLTCTKFPILSKPPNSQEEKKELLTPTNADPSSSTSHSNPSIQPTLTSANATPLGPPNPTTSSSHNPRASSSIKNPETSQPFTQSELDEFARGKLNANGDTIYFKPGFIVDDPWARAREFKEKKKTKQGGIGQVQSRR